MPALRFLRARRFTRTATVLCAGLFVLACTPTFNWRDVRLSTGTLAALLPCKPDRAQRSVELGGGRREMEMIGCEAGGAMFAVARVQAGDAEMSKLVLGQWRAATLQSLRAPEQPLLPWTAPGGLALAGTGKLGTQVSSSDATPLTAHVAWLAAPGTKGLDLYQAMVVGKQLEPSVVETFMDSLRFP